METELKQRMVGASVIIALAVIFIPMLFDDTNIEKNQVLSIEIPDEPVQLKHKVIKIDTENTSVDTGTDTPEKSSESQDRSEKEAKSQVVKTQETILDVVDNSKPVETTGKAKEKLKESDEPKNTAKQVDDSSVISKQADKSATDKKTTGVPDTNDDSKSFRLKLGVFSQQKNAQQLKARLINKNYDAVVVKDIDSNVYKVYSGIFNSRKDAESLVGKINALHLNIGKPVIEEINAELFDSMLDTGWILQIGIYSAKENAIKQRDSIRKSGFVSFVDEVKTSADKKQYRVRVGPYATREEALSQQTQILKLMKLKSLVKPHEKQKVVGK